MSKIIGEDIFCSEKLLFNNLFNKGYAVKQLERKLIGFKNTDIDKIGFYFPRKNIKESILIGMRISEYRQNKEDCFREFNLILRDLNKNKENLNKDYFSKNIIYDFNNYFLSDVYIGDFANAWLNYNYKNN